MLRGHADVAHRLQALREQPRALALLAVELPDDHRRDSVARHAARARGCSRPTRRCTRAAGRRRRSPPSGPGSGRCRARRTTSTFPVAASGSSAARWNGDLTAISAKSNSPSSSSAEATASSGTVCSAPSSSIRQAGVAQRRHVLLVGVQHDDAPDVARELRGRDAADRAAADDEDARVGHETGCAGSAATSVRRKRPAPRARRALERRVVRDARGQERAEREDRRERDQAAVGRAGGVLHEPDQVRARRSRRGCRSS